MSIRLIVSIILALVGYTLGEYFSKQWALTYEVKFAMTAFTVYLFSNVGWLGIMLHFRDIFIPSVIWELTGLMIAALMGLVVFSERPTVMQWGGIGFAAVAVGLLLFGGK